jgi:hypothetical protein
MKASLEPAALAQLQLLDAANEEAVKRAEWEFRLHRFQLTKLAIVNDQCTTFKIPSNSRALPRGEGPLAMAEKILDEYRSHTELGEMTYVSLSGPSDGTSRIIPFYEKEHPELFVQMKQFHELHRARLATVSDFVSSHKAGARREQR